MLAGWSLALSCLSCRPQINELAVLKVGHAMHDHHAPLFVAALNPDYFMQNGGIYLKATDLPMEYILIKDNRDVAKVVIEPGLGGGELIRKLYEHYTDISFGGMPALLHFIDQGAPIKILAPVMSEGAGLVVSNFLPAHDWDSFGDMVRCRTRPLRIGYKGSVSVQNLIFETALTACNIKWSKNIHDTDAQIVLINLYGARNLIPAMENSFIDGFVVMQPYPVLAESKGVGKTIARLKDLPPKGSHKGYPCCVLAANELFVSQHPRETEIFLKLMKNANLFIRQYPEKSARQVAGWLRIPMDVEHKSLPLIRFHNETDVQWNRGVDFWVKSMIEQGRLTGRVKQAYEAHTLEQLIYEDRIFTDDKMNTVP